MEQNSDDKGKDSHGLRMYLESLRYLSDIRLLDNIDKHHSIPIAMYIMGCHLSLPVKTIIVGERPYATRIHPEISSAMSYDPKKSRATPSTVGVTMDLVKVMGCKYQETEAWFRDSWKFIPSGIVVVNCMTFLPFSSPDSLSEMVPFQRWLRALLKLSMSMSNDDIDLICMGIPALNAVQSVLRNIGSDRSRVKKKEYPNPAIWSKMKFGDSTSQVNTFNKEGTSKAIFSAIKRSRRFREATVQDYVDEITSIMSFQIPMVNNVIAKSTSLVDRLEDAYKDVEKNHKMPGIKEANDEFVRALIEYRDSVLRDLVANAISSKGDYSNKVGKSTEWGGKKKWEKPAPSVGTSSRMSVVSEENEGIEQKFADDESGNEKNEDGDATATEDQPKEVKKKKVIRKRIVRKKKPSQTTTNEGSSLDDAGISTLRASLYYISDAYGSSSQSLQDQMSKSMETGVAESHHVAVIVDTAVSDMISTGTDANASLGLKDGEVSDVCMLPKLLKKLCETSG